MNRSVLVGAMLAVLGVTGLVHANEGGLIFGARLGGNYSYANMSIGSYNNRGGFGVEAGPIARYAVVPGELGVNVGANVVWRNPVDVNNPLYTYQGNEVVVSIPALIEINPALLGLRSGSSVYEMMFVQLGLQLDVVANYMDELNGVDMKGKYIDRAATDVSIVVGAVGYFTSNLSLDIRYAYAFNSFAKSNWSNNVYMYNASLGLSFFF